MTAALAVEIDRGRSAVKIPFGRNTNGKMVSIDAVIRGLACECFCSACDAPLVARKGEKNQHHFAHYVETENCAEARETALHKFAKELICEVRDLHLPDNLNLGQIQDAKSEQWLDGIRPDVLAQFDELVAIEIRVAHAVPTEKIQKFVVRKLAALEIDLSPYRTADKNEDEWRDLVLRTAPRFWLFQPAIVREKIEREAREAAAREIKQEAERKARIERELREAAERKAKQARQEAERREWIQAKTREEQEWQRLVTESQLQANERKQQRLAAEKAAEAEYEAYQKQLKQEELKQEERFLEGLKICADTKRHLDEWERRKQEAALRSNPQ